MRRLAPGEDEICAGCEHRLAGYDPYHCIAPPEDLDVWRTALFIGLLHASDQLRLVAVDGQIGPPVEQALGELCESGWLEPAVCNAELAMKYEVTDEDRGIYRFHHHHLHVSMTNPAYSPDSAQSSRQ